MAFLPKIRIGMSVKLFLAFWLVIISSGLISHLITMQLKKTPSQTAANPEQLILLNQFSETLQQSRKQNFKALRNKFIRKYDQH